MQDTAAVTDLALGTLEKKLHEVLATYAGNPVGLCNDGVVREVVRDYVLRVKALEGKPEAVVIRVKRILAAIPSPASTPRQVRTRYQEAFTLICIEEYFDYRRPRT